MINRRCQIFLRVTKPINFFNLVIWLWNALVIRSIASHLNHYAWRFRVSLGLEYSIWLNRAFHQVNLQFFF